MADPLPRKTCQRERASLGDVGGDAPGLIAGEEVRRPSASRLVLEVDVKKGKRLVVGGGEGDAIPVRAQSAWHTDQQ
jgi:hypothetical protein